MILIVGSRNDAILRSQADNSARNNPAFGSVYKAFNDVLPTLGSNEDLVISAHGSANFRGGPAIGDPQSDFYVTPSNLVENIKSIIPINYNGRIYFDACSSASESTDQSSFIKQFDSDLRNSRPDVNTSIYGRDGSISAEVDIPALGSPEWISAGEEA